MLTSLKIPSIGAAVLLQLPLLVILGHIQRIDVSTNMIGTLVSSRSEASVFLGEGFQLVC